jgi:hypothetical protein
LSPSINASIFTVGRMMIRFNTSYVVPKGNKAHSQLRINLLIVSFHMFLSSMFDIVIVCVTQVSTHLQTCRHYSTENPVILLVRCTKYPMRSNKYVHFIMSLRPAAISVALSLTKPLPAVMWGQFSPLFIGQSWIVLNS